MSFKNLEVRSPDPILNLLEIYAADPRPDKINLGVGVYMDATGVTPIMKAVKKAEKVRFEREKSKSYLPLSGVSDYSDLGGELILGENHAAITEGRAFHFHTPGATAGLRVAFELVREAYRQPKLHISDPTWPNHAPIATACGIRTAVYPYYDYENGCLARESFFNYLANLTKGNVVLVHGCCHNPSGADLSREDWRLVADLALKHGFLVLIDNAYQGLADGVDEDVYGIRLLANSLPELVVVSSSSKNFGIYRERAGILTVIGADRQTTLAAKTTVAAIVRGLYSMASAHGGVLVATVLGDAELRKEWLTELAAMRARIKEIRHSLAVKIGADFQYIATLNGLFTMLGVSPQNVKRLRDEHAIYVLDSGRVNLAGLNDDNIDRFCEAVSGVIGR